jgi:chromobox protein 1
VMNEYFEEIGGRPEQKSTQKRKGRASGVTKSESGTPASSVKRVKQEQTWSPPQGSWEHDVDFIDTVEERADPKTGELAKFAYLVWNNDKKTQHPLRHIYLKCPQKVRWVQTLLARLANEIKMLLYYESHLVFTQNDGLNGDDESMKDVY